MPGLFLAPNSGQLPNLGSLFQVRIWTLLISHDDDAGPASRLFERAGLADQVAECVLNDVMGLSALSTHVGTALGN